jgi:hypothetical protein
VKDECEGKKKDGGRNIGRKAYMKEGLRWNDYMTEGLWEGRTIGWNEGKRAGRAT